MNEILLLLLPIVGVFAIGCSIALLALGKMIDRFPVGDESRRERGLASPVESTKIAVIIFWVLFIIGCWSVLQGTTFGLILGITTFFAICLFMFTALVFSFAVLSTMRRRRDRAQTPVIQVGTPDTIVTISQQGRGQPAVVSKKRYNHPVSSFMIDALLKKD